MEDDGHSVIILDSNGKRVEWNGEDYVEKGSTSSKVINETQTKDKDKDDKDSDQYLVRNIFYIDGFGLQWFLNY